MHHMAITFHHHLLGDSDRSCLRDPTNIVSCKINQHDVFSTLLRVFLELFFQRQIIRGVATTGLAGT